MKEVIENIFDKDVPLKEKENQEKQELINILLEKIKEEKTKDGNK